jgi:hypothetical protein
MTITKKFTGVYYQINDDFLIKRILERIEPVDILSSDKLFIFSHIRNRFYLKLFTILAHALSKKGYPSCFLFNDRISYHYPFKLQNFNEQIYFFNKISLKSFEVGTHFPNLKIDNTKISNSLIEEKSKTRIINRYQTKKNLYFNWKIDLTNGITKVKDIDFFPIMRTTLRAVLKRYNIDFKNKNVISKSKEMIQSMDLLLQYLMLLKKFSKMKNKKIKIIGWEYSYIPNGFFNISCKELVDNRDVEYIDISRGYKHYFGGHSRQSYFSAVNLTQSVYRNRNSISKNQVLQIIRNVDKKEVVKPINIVFNKAKKSHQISEEQKPIINKCTNFLKDGNNVFVLFSHLFYDNPVYDCTNAFKDMCDWINYTIKIFKNSKDLLLLKPHPKEVRLDIPEAQPNETLESYINKNFSILPSNIILLKPRTFNLYHLFPYITCGLIWKSSASNELSYLGKSCIISGPSPFKQALDDLHYSQSKNHYESLIKNVENLQVTDQQKIKIAAYIYALYNKDVEVKQFTNDRKYNNPYLDREKIFDYLKNGDTAIEKLVEDMIK